MEFFELGYRPQDFAGEDPGEVEESEGGGAAELWRAGPGEVVGGEREVDEVAEKADFGWDVAREANGCDVERDDPRAGVARDFGEGAMRKGRWREGGGGVDPVADGGGGRPDHGGFSRARPGRSVQGKRR